METNAILSSCRRYRYSLRRIWDDAKPKVTWIMLNPSTADETEGDPTIRKCISFSQAWGAGSIQVVNLFALRSPHPSLLYNQEDNCIGVDNDQWISKSLVGADSVVCAWGTHGTYLYRGDDVLKLIAPKTTPLCLGLTENKQPKHPLYLPMTTQRVPVAGGGLRVCDLANLLRRK